MFHAGVLRRLNEGAYLPAIDRISSVSGGSITAGTLGLNWRKLNFVEGVANNFEEAFVQPIRTLAVHTIDIGSVLSGVFGFGTIADKIADHYRKYLFGNSTFQDLPDLWSAKTSRGGKTHKFGCKIPRFQGPDHKTLFTDGRPVRT